MNNTMIEQIRSALGITGITKTIQEVSQDIFGVTSDSSPTLAEQVEANSQAIEDLATIVLEGESDV